MTRFKRAALRTLAALLPLALLCGGCGDDEGGGPGPYDSEFLGIWTVDSWTENAESCDAEGESVLEQNGNSLLLVQACTINFGFKVDYLHALECTDEADCEDKRCEENELNFGGRPSTRATTRRAGLVPSLLPLAPRTTCAVARSPPTLCPRTGRGWFCALRPWRPRCSLRTSKGAATLTLPRRWRRVSRA
jgi:hypothetical protein